MKWVPLAVWVLVMALLLAHGMEVMPGRRSLFIFGMSVSGALALYRALGACGD